MVEDDVPEGAVPRPGEPDARVRELRSLGQRLEGELQSASRIRAEARRTLLEIGFATRSAHSWSAVDRPLILLVDDEPGSAYPHFLDQQGYRVALAADGAEAVQRAHAERPAVIVMDLQMPHVDGWEATRRLKADAVTKEIPVVVVTAHAGAEARRRAEAAGCDGFCVKPCAPDALLAEILRTLLSKTHARRERGRGLRGARVLVVEDHRDSREMLRAALEAAGAEVTEAEGRGEALAHLREQGFDLVVSDVHLPDGTAHELIRELRTWPEDRGGTTPALALTAFSTADDQAEALQAGFDGYFAKPVEPALLQRVASDVSAARARHVRG